MSSKVGREEMNVHDINDKALQAVRRRSCPQNLVMEDDEDSYKKVLKNKKASQKDGGVMSN